MSLPAPTGLPAGKLSYARRAAVAVALLGSVGVASGGLACSAPGAPTGTSGQERPAPSLPPPPPVAASAPAATPIALVPASTTAAAASSGASAAPPPPFPPPVTLPGIFNARHITAYHSYFAVTTIENGLLQSREREKLGTAALIPGGWAGVERVAAGERATCAVAGSEVRCWGARKDGMLGDVDAVSTNVPVAVQGVGKAADIAAGDDYACALLGSGKVICWGELVEGKDIVRPTSIALPAARQVVVGEEHACALLVSGEVQCWGSIRRGTETVAATPMAIPLPGKATTIVAGEWHTCALLESGAVSCFGGNHERQATSAGPGDADVDVSPAFDGPVVELAAGGAATCVRRPDARVFCRGSFGSGFKPAIELREPTHVPAFDGATSLQVMPNLVCAATAAGLVCLAANDV